MQDLKDVTADVHYENFRASYIQESMAGQQKERRWDTFTIFHFKQWHNIADSHFVPPPPTPYFSPPPSPNCFVNVLFLS